MSSPLLSSLRHGLAERLADRCARAVSRARRSGEGVLVSVSAELPGEVDPSAAAYASRRGDEPWFLFEQPDRSGWALAAVGEATRLEAAGPGRFSEVSGRWRALVEGAVFDAPASGPLAVGGFAFAPAGGDAPHWSGFAAASLLVPALALSRWGERVTLTLTALARPGDAPQALCEALLGRAQALAHRPLPLLDPAPVERARVVSAMPPEHYEEAVARGVERIRAGQLEKIVLAREVQVHAPAVHDPGAVYGVLREAFPSCFVYAVGRGGSTFIGASPELLIRREGMRAGTIALAGSTRRSSDPAVDDHLGEGLLHSEKDREEHAIVARRIERTLRARSVWVTTAPEPTLVRVANIQHLATPIRAQLAEPVDVVDLVGLMHPTPAVGGEPFAVAAPLIPALEGLDRGWYAGPIGYTDAAGDGEFCVALRCALLTGAVARCYAGVGVVRDSDPAAELAETDVKLQALLPVLAM
jgi:salicylate biosynthesis isochorismate synthase